MYCHSYTADYDPRQSSCLHKAQMKTVSSGILPYSNAVSRLSVRRWTSPTLVFCSSIVTNYGIKTGVKPAITAGWFEGEQWSRYMTSCHFKPSVITVKQFRGYYYRKDSNPDWFWKIKSSLTCYFNSCYQLVTRNSNKCWSISSLNHKFSQGLKSERAGCDVLRCIKCNLTISGYMSYGCHWQLGNYEISRVVFLFWVSVGCRHEIEINA